MPLVNRRQLIAWLVPLIAVAGCGNRADQKVALADVSALSTETLLGVLLGPAPERRSSLMVTPEPPLLIRGAKETVLLATDFAGFVRESQGALSESDIKLIEADVAKSAGTILKKQGFTLTPVPFPIATDDVNDKTLFAAFTPVTEVGGSPQDKKTGKSRTYVLIRLTVTDPRTNTVLRVREFYSGRDAGVKDPQ